MLKDFHEQLKYRGDKKWDNDKPVVNYDFDGNQLNGPRQSYNDMLKDLRG